MSEKPWLLIVGLFVVLIAAWTVLVYIAQTNQPETVPLETAGADSGGDADD